MADPKPITPFFSTDPRVIPQPSPEPQLCECHGDGIELEEIADNKPDLRQAADRGGAVKERPILFQGAMVRALLAGTKTQTRRIVKGERASRGMESGWYLKPYGFLSDRLFAKAACPYGQPGDRLYVREAHCYVGPGSGSDLPSYVAEARDPANHKPENCWYRADGERGVVWTPGIHMFRGLSRILLELTEVRVQRLQEISEADAIAEGTPGGHGAIPGYSYAATPIEHYRWLWDQINGAGAWDANPWVWAVSFRRVQP